MAARDDTEDMKTCDRCDEKDDGRLRWVECAVVKTDGQGHRIPQKPTMGAILCPACVGELLAEFTKFRHEFMRAAEREVDVPTN